MRFKRVRKNSYKLGRFDETWVCKLDDKRWCVLTELDGTYYKSKLDYWTRKSAADEWLKAIDRSEFFKNEPISPLTLAHVLELTEGQIFSEELRSL